MKQNAFSLVAYLLCRKTSVIHPRLCRTLCLAFPGCDPTAAVLEWLGVTGVRCARGDGLGL